MSQPTDERVTLMLSLAGSAKCSRDKRAAIVAVPQTGRVIGHGTNGPPGVLRCEDVCRRGQTCREKAEHAEAAAIRHAVTHEGAIGGTEIVHAATSTNGQLVTSRPPTEKACASCAVAMVAHSVAAIWLYVEPGEWQRFTAGYYYEQAVGL